MPRWWPGLPCQRPGSSLKRDVHPSLVAARVDDAHPSRHLSQASQYILLAGPFHEGDGVRPQILGEEIRVLVSEVVNPEQVDVGHRDLGRVAVPDGERGAPDGAGHPQGATGPTHERRLTGPQLALYEHH